jgi:predicted signal transduction protein with EAL and GGDEF domain
VAGQRDALIVAISERLREVVPRTDTVARYGPDVFAVLLGERGDRVAVEQTAAALLAAVAAPWSAGDRTVSLTASIGIALTPEDGDDGFELLLKADRALMGAKAAGRNRVGYFTAAVQEAAEQRARLLEELQGAIGGGQLCLHYQPIVDLRTGAIWKAEALVRWNHPTLGLIGPATFIPLAEAHDLIHPLGDWVLAEAADRSRRWRERFVPDFQMSVNRSPAQFAPPKDRPGLVSWAERVRLLGVPGESLSMEITEGLLLDDSAGAEAELLRAREAGIAVALDDFGTGYSALAYLPRYAIDIVKLDRAFVSGLTPDSKSFAVCRGIVSLAHDLGMLVVAEGIETESQRDLLRSVGCDFAQGYYFGRPVPAEEFEARYFGAPPVPAAPSV